MIKTTTLFLLIAIAVFLTACPYQSPYAIDETPQQSIDENLLGSWATMVAKPAFDGDYEEEPIKIIFSKKTDTEYDITLTGYIKELKKFITFQNDSIKATGFLSTVEGTVFLNVAFKNQYLLAEVKQDKNKFSILFLKENFTPRFSKNANDVKKSVIYHYKTSKTPFYDEWLVLKNLQRVK
jgi:hypothetical protein